LKAVGAGLSPTPYKRGLGDGGVLIRQMTVPGHTTRRRLAARDPSTQWQTAMYT